MADKAQKEKQKGNEAFKVGDYPAAVGHYTAAILADRGDVTFPLNRAAAYLKLGKYEDAERDCSTVLNLSSKNVKAFFRRGQARSGLGHLVDAQRDFTEALRLEPENKATKEELKKIAELIEAEKRKKLGQRQINSTFDAALQPASTPKRRRVPITIVEPPTATPSTAEPKAKSAATTPSASSQPGEQSNKTPPPPPTALEGIRESSSRPLKPSTISSSPEYSNILKSTASTSSQSQIQNSPTSSATPATPSTSTSTSTPISSGPSASSSVPQPNEQPISPISASKWPLAANDVPSSFAEAKQAREAKSQSGRVGGGIFRASGQSTVFPTKSSSSAAEVAGSPAAETASAKTAQSPQSAENGDAGVGAGVRVTQAREEEEKVSTVESPSKIPPTKADGRGTAPVGEAPGTLFDLIRAWRSVLTSLERWKLLQTIPPSRIPAFCKTSLEPPLLDSILEVFLVVLSALPTEEDRGKVKEYMESLEKVPRFGTLVMFLNKREKAVAKEVWRKLGCETVAPPGCFGAERGDDGFVVVASAFLDAPPVELPAKAMFIRLSSRLHMSTVSFPISSHSSILLSLLASVFLLAFIRAALLFLRARTSSSSEKQALVHAQQQKNVEQQSPAPSPSSSSSWRLGFFTWESLPTLPVSLKLNENDMKGRGVGFVPPSQRPAAQPWQPGRRSGPAFEHPPAAMYQTEEPVSMAKMIMSRHTFRKPAHRPPPRPKTGSQMQYTRRPASMV
ncbi:hypothetical protein NP233_g949 [Leucocoprinus birnbaumii]|uniref:RNA polymerase II-associated protein 3 n=1 Tax=Leucocoprinus birnbaumii TaxID=56174 RepID=A0AAD5W1F7_9AGAR|nr:hypothetical protein NP233_g949 [Leucocoprinus birnbaumii]